jgi:hypothetical protein
MALLNASTFLNKNGVIIHALCANNWINHGFYQISPDLFYSLYSEKMGILILKFFYRLIKRINTFIGLIKLLVVKEQLLKVLAKLMY